MARWRRPRILIGVGLVLLLAAGAVAAQGPFSAQIQRALRAAFGAGSLTLSNTTASGGIRLQFEGTPTITSGFGTGPSIAAGSTDTSGAINIGLGAVADTGVVTFATPWPTAPRCLLTQDKTSGSVTIPVVTTTTLTLGAQDAWPAATTIYWWCVGQP